MSRIFATLFCALTVLLMSGCGTAQYSIAPSANTAMSPTPRGATASATSGEAAGFDAQPLDQADAGEAADPEVQYKPQIIYTAELGLQADRVVVAQDRAEAVVSKHRGYVSESRTGYLLVRVPADRFEVALDELAGLGQVTKRQVKAQEVTEQVTDLESRLRSAESMQARLIELLDRANDMEAALKIQQQLAKVVEQIELIQGRLRLVKNQIAYSTITLSIAATPAEQRLRPEIPVVWVREIGDVFRERNRIDVTTPRKLRDGVDVELPEGFVRYYQEEHVTQAINAEGLRIRVRRMKNFGDGGGNVAFWSQLITRSLRENAHLNMADIEALTLSRDKQAKLLQGDKQIAGETIRYAAAVSATDDYVYVYEIWGVAEAFDRIEKQIESSMQSMEAYETLL